MQRAGGDATKISGSPRYQLVFHFTGYTAHEMKGSLKQGTADSTRNKDEARKVVGR